MSSGEQIAVYGATGHTGRKVIAELERRGIPPIVVGRDVKALAPLGLGRDGAVRAANLDDGDALRAAFEGSAAVINCVGPFQRSAEPVLAATIDADAHYLDFTAEQEPVSALFERWDGKAQAARLAVVPAMGFYGGLGDLLASIAAEGLGGLDSMTLAYAVEGWLLTAASRATAAAMAGRRWVWRDRALELVTDAPRYGRYEYPEPRGTQPVMEDYPLPEAITVPTHTDVRDVHLLMTASTLSESFGPDAPAPNAVSDEQRAASAFTVVATATDGRGERCVMATGTDIYGLTAPMIVAAAQAVIASEASGVLAPSRAVVPSEFLSAMAAHGLIVEPAKTRRLERHAQLGGLPVQSRSPSRRTQ